MVRRETVAINEATPRNRPMGLFDDINTRISENLQHHGYYLTDPHAAEDEQIAETIDILIHCVRPERREAVRVQIIDILRCEAIPTKVLRVQDRLPVHLVSVSSLWSVNRRHGWSVRRVLVSPAFHVVGRSR